jgi:DNA-binding helix-turn-helix protein
MYTNMVILAEKRAKSEIDLRKLMKKMGLRANAFAELCGISTQSLAQFLRPDKSLTTNTIYRIANALDIDPRDMFFPVGEEVVNEKIQPNRKQKLRTSWKKARRRKTSHRTTTFRTLLHHFFRYTLLFAQVVANKCA